MSTQHPTAAKAASRSESIIAQARALEPTIRSLLAGINAVLESRPEGDPPLGNECHANDRTDNRIRAYLASMRPMEGVDYRDDIEAANQRGRSLIERLALSAEGNGLPSLRLTASDVADVLSFIHCSEPVDPENWWREPAEEASHVVGLYLLAQSLEESLRAGSASAPASLPEALADHLQEQHTRISELLSLLERLDEDADQMYTRIAVREAEELERALDSMTLAKVLKGEEARS